MSIITISRQYASSGSEVAEHVARRLGWQLYDNSVVDTVAARLGITPAEVSAREERRPSMAERLVEMTSRVMQEAVQAGPAVIVGRGAQCLLASRTDALHVFCYAPMEALVAHAVEKLGVRREDAHRTVTEMNEQRDDYVKRHWKREWRDLANYHLCVNTAWLGTEGAAELIVQVARERFGMA